MAANVSGFNTVFTYDIWQAYVRRDRSDDYYLRVGRIATIVGVVIGIGTAFIAAGFSTVMNYIQTLFSLFNAPLFATFTVGMFWKRMSAWAGFWSLLLGFLASLTLYLLHLGKVVNFNSAREESFWGAGLAFVTAVVVAVLVTLVTHPKPESDLRGLVYGLAGRAAVRRAPGDRRAVPGVRRDRHAAGHRRQRGRDRQGQGCGSTSGWAWGCSCWACSCCSGCGSTHRPRRICPRRPDRGTAPDTDRQPCPAA
jgi:Sodium:solute symporter family